MPAPTKRRPKGATEPAKKEEVPEYLSKAYGIRFVAGQPDIPGWGAGLARAEALLADPEFAWLEELAQLRAALAVTPSAADEKRLKAKIRKARRAIRAGDPYPHLGARRATASTSTRSFGPLTTNDSPSNCMNGVTSRASIAELATGRSSPDGLGTATTGASRC